MPTLYTAKHRPAVISIYGIHSKRLGHFRTALGALLMYSTVPLFLLLHTTVALFMYRKILRPLLKLPMLYSRDYVILDRYNLSSLHWFDRLNCLFCEYANGITQLVQDEIMVVVSHPVQTSFLQRCVIVLYLVPQTFLVLLGMLIATVPTNILMNLLGLHRASHKRILDRLQRENFGSLYGTVMCRIIRMYKLTADILSYNLEQIESAWCPIRHYEREGQHLPMHHKNFFERDNLTALQSTLTERGTVSDKPPKQKVG